MLTDPPYNISRPNNFNTIGRKGTDFGEWDKGFDLIGWLDNIGEIIDKNGSIIIFNDWKNLGIIAWKLEQEGFEIKDTIQWVKPNPMPRNTNRRYVTNFEFAIWAVKKKGKWTFNKPIDIPYLKPQFISPSPSSKNRIHPTQKPESLIAEIIQIHSNPTDIIFDPFSGSGTISQVAYKMDRYYIGAEINKTYWTDSLKRLDKNFISPAFNHLGNKKRLSKELNKHMLHVNINTLVDVFAGTGIVGINNNQVKKIFLNDFDVNLINLLSFLKNVSSKTIISKVEKIIDEYGLPRQKAKYKLQYEKLKVDYNQDKNIVKLLVLIIFGFNQQIRFNSNGDFNIPAGKIWWSDHYKNKIIQFSNALKNKEIHTFNLDFQEFIDSIIEQVDKNETIFYFDPPYLLTNATYNSDWTNEQEIRLLNLIKNLHTKGYKWCLSNVLVSKGKVNKYLKNFINDLSNTKLEVIHLEDISYSNSNYQRKDRDKKDVEVLLKGNLS